MAALLEAAIGERLRSRSILYRALLYCVARSSTLLLFAFVNGMLLFAAVWLLSHGYYHDFRLSTWLYTGFFGLYAGCTRAVRGLYAEFSVVCTGFSVACTGQDPASAEAAAA